MNITIPKNELCGTVFEYGLKGRISSTFILMESHACARRQEDLPKTTSKFHMNTTVHVDLL